MPHDAFGLPLTAADSAAVRHFDDGVQRLLVFRNDPVAAADAAVAADPGLVMAHVLKGLLCVLGTEKSLLPDAQRALQAGRAAARGATLARERLHLDALAAWVDGRLAQACAAWESILVDHPTDALAMFAAHQGDFFLGQSSELRDRVARRLADVPRDSTLEGYYLGMYAFGLEETGDFAAAEDAGRRAVARDGRDAWAVHAVAHVMEMANRTDEGIAWLTDHVEGWATDNFFAVHNWWHLALYHLDRGDTAAVLQLYDQRIRGSNSTAILDLLDASALLWRLWLHGVDVGARWQPLVPAWEPRLDDGWYAFNDTHAMMAFAAAGRDDLAARLLAVMARAAGGAGDNAVMTRAVGLPVARALHACAQGRWGEAVALLLPVKAIAARAGGSHAQRDLIAQTLAVAAERAGQRALAHALLNERLALKPRSPFNRRWRERLEPEG